MFNSYSSRTDRQNQRSLGGIVAVIVGIGVGMGLLQNIIVDYKVARAHISEAVILSSTAETLTGYDFAVISGDLGQNGPVAEPFSGATVYGSAAIWMTEEVYRRSGKSSSWHTDRTTYNEAGGLHVGNYQIAANFLEQHSNQVKQRMLPDMLPLARLLSSRAYAYQNGSYIYTDSRHRFGFSHIRTGQQVTLMGHVEATANGQAVVSPSPEMSSTYPALWPGRMSPDDIMAALTRRLLSVLLGMGGIVFLLSWVGMAITNLFISESRRMDNLGVALAAFFGATASMGCWYLYPSFIIALPATLGLCITSFGLMLSFLGPKRISSP